jgi:hypothetical protein
VRVDSEAVEGIKAKINRAHDHLEFLNGEFQVWLKGQPYGLDREIHAQGAKHVWRLRITEPMPPMWGVILGEMIHDLRSALDQAVYWLTIDNRGVELPGTQFPIFTSRLGRPSKGAGKPGRVGFAQVSVKAPDGINGSGLYMIRGVGPGPRAFIERIQPYPQRNGPLPKALLGLHEFWNQDKHRLAHLFGLGLRESQVHITSRMHPSNYKPWVAPNLLRDKAIAVRLTCAVPDPDVDVRITGKLYPGVKYPVRSRRQAHVTIKDVFWDCAAVAARLVEAIGRQDEPVPL